MKLFGLLCYLVIGVAAKQIPEKKHVFENGTMIDKVEGRIAGGQAVKSIMEFPYVVQVFLSQYFYCSGAIISENYIITGAECFLIGAEDIEVRAGSKFRGEGILIPIAEAVRHPNFGEEAYYDCDISYLRTVSPIAFNENIQPGILPGDKLRELVVTVTGWGEQDSEESELTSYSLRLSSYVLKAVELELIEVFGCQDIYEEEDVTITGNMICAEDTTYHDKGACEGDRGAPLTVGSKIYGISSYTYKCGPGMYPSIFTYLRSDIIRKFITEGTGVQYVHTPDDS